MTTTEFLKSNNVVNESMGKYCEAEEEAEDEESMFLPCNIIQWEDDIIYDPQLSTNKVAASARQNAVYAGWIPSQVCRTLASFQVHFFAMLEMHFGFFVIGLFFSVRILIRTSIRVYWATKR